MERLTKRMDDFYGEINEIAFINPDDREGWYNLRNIVEWSNDERLYEIANRLASYEDTGLIPEMCAVYKKVEDRLVASGITFSRLLELVEADKEGRCVVLPCKVGDEIFSFRWNVKAAKSEVVAGKVKDVSVRHDSLGDTVRISDGERYGDIFGKTVFLARAEAEAALKEW